MRLCPLDPLWFLSTLGQVFRGLRKIEDSIDASIEMTRRDPDNLEGHIGLAEILGEAGRTQDAKRAAAEVLGINPDFLINEYIGNLSYRDPD